MDTIQTMHHDHQGDYLPPVAQLPPLPPHHHHHHHEGNHTRNYGLPLWKASDVTSWLTQMNAAMMRIDEVMHDLALRTGVNGVADDLAKSVGLLLNDVEVLKCNMSDINNKAASNELLMQNMTTQMSAMHTNMSSLELTLTNLDTRIMTVESKNQNQDNSMTLLKSDLQQVSAGLKSLREAIGEYENANNQTLAQVQSQVNNLSDDVEKLKAPEFEFVRVLDDTTNPVTNVTVLNNSNEDISESVDEVMITERASIFRLGDFAAVRLPSFTIKFKQGVTLGSWCSVQFPELTEAFTKFGKMQDYSGTSVCFCNGNPVRLQCAPKSDGTIPYVKFAMTADIYEKIETEGGTLTLRGMPMMPAFFVE